MTRLAVDDAVAEQDLVRLRAPLRRYLARTVPDEPELDDLVQETLLRLWEVRARVGRGAAASYAVATARNLVQDRDRRLQVQQRHAHRLHVPPTVDGPEVHALRREEQLAVAELLSTLDREDLEVLAGTEEQERERSARQRSRLARARARARVDYLLHLRRLELPTAQCRPVLEALSTGDRRGQERVRAGEHLLGCRVCTGCVEPLLTRQRRLFGVVAVPLLVLLEPVRRAWHSAPGATAAAGTATAAAAVVVVGSLVVSGAVPTSRPVPPVPATTGAAPAGPAPVPLALDGAGGFDLPLGAALGRPVRAQSVAVLSVPADEGFWVGPDEQDRAYVRLAAGAESPVTVRAGDRVSFTGRVERLTPDAEQGVTPAEGLGHLRAQGALVLVVPADLTVED